MSEAVKSTKRTLDLSKLDRRVADAAGGFLEEVIRAGGERVLSIAVVGSAVTADYRPGKSDINSIIVVDETDMAFLDALAQMGKRVGKKGLAAPLLVTPEYIAHSLDSFALEFLEFQSAHAVVFGEDYLSGIMFDKADLRLAAERGLKGLAVNLRRGYLSCLGDAAQLRALLVTSLNAAAPVLRGMLYYAGTTCPATKAECIRAAQKAFNLPAEPFERILSMRDGEKPDMEELRSIFKGFHDALEAQSETIDKG